MKARESCDLFHHSLSDFLQTCGNECQLVVIGKFRQLTTNLWPLIDVRNSFSHSITDFLQTLHESSELILGIAGHCVIYGVESWSGVLEWSHGMEFWSGLWSGMGSDFEFLSPF